MKFGILAEYFARLETTAKRLEMTAVLAELFRHVELEKEEIDKLIYLCQGRLLPAFENVEFGMNEKLISRAIAEAAGTGASRIKELFDETGDYGLVAEKLGAKKKEALSVGAVYGSLREITLAGGEGAVAKKIGLLAQLLRKISAPEAKYAVRIMLGRLRLGIGDPTVLDGLSTAYGGDKSLRIRLERAYNICSDLGLVARVLFAKGLDQLDSFLVTPGRPIRPALAERLSSAQEIIEKIGPCAVEAKYDGFRCQVHKNGDDIRIFSRNLENTTGMFPEIRNAAVSQIKKRRAVFEGEAVSYNPDTGEYLPFQSTVQRKRKHNIAQMQKLFPLRLFVFDMLYADADITHKTYAERREIMSESVAEKENGVLKISPVSILRTPKELNDFFEDAVTRGLEGIVAKRLDAAYQAGARNFNWIKLKRSYEGALHDTIDCVLAGYFFGRGRRAAFGIGSLLACVYDQKSDSFKTIAKIGSGLSEKEWVEIKRMLETIRRERKPERVDSLIVPDVWVEPKFVVEVQADEITRSPVHTCGKKTADEPGFALRFPRLARFIREDKSPQDATSTAEIKAMFKAQRRKK